MTIVPVARQLLFTFILAALAAPGLAGAPQAASAGTALVVSGKPSFVASASEATASRSRASMPRP